MSASTLMRLDNTFARELPQCGVPWKPAAVPEPRLLFLNRTLATELGLDADALAGAEGAAMLCGNVLPAGAAPVAQAYAGHQFGGFSPQLGDGRAVLLGELAAPDGRPRDLALKGSGRTPFSRGGDGKAAVGPMLREALISEAMHALGIPTTRALAVVATGEHIFREQALPGAVLARVAASHLRVGSFQYFAARRELDLLRALADHAIARHDPALAGAPDRHLQMLRAVANRQAALIAQWMTVGFIHGVMNTDNMTLSGETIDYGPCAFLETYDPATVFSSIDHQGRYAYGNQPSIALWNLTRFAESLLPLLSEDEDRSVMLATEVLDGFAERYAEALLRAQRAKLGLTLADTQTGVAPDDAADAALADDWLALLAGERVDFTLAWRRLADAAAGDEGPLRALFAQPDAPASWLARWHARCEPEVSGAQRADAMRRVNPWIIPRNHRVEEALAAASDDGDLGPFERLLEALRRPFDEDPAHARYAEPAPAEVTAGYRTFCGT